MLAANEPRIYGRTRMRASGPFLVTLLVAVAGCGSGNQLDAKVSHAYGSKVSHCKKDEASSSLANAFGGSSTIYDCRVPTGAGTGSQENWQLQQIELDGNGNLVQDDGSTSAVGPDGKSSGTLKDARRAPAMGLAAPAPSC